MITEHLRNLKNRVAPQGRQVRRLPVGIGSGIRLPLDFRYETGLYFGLYERELNQHISELCQPGFAAFDVGGYLGYDALVLAKLSQGGRVASFEADPARCALIEQAVRANDKFAARVTVHNAFVGAPSEDPPVFGLDDFAYGPTGFVPDVMKIDIEGAELDALSGARRLLEQRRPHLIIEVHSAQLEQGCGAFLVKAGYAPLVVEQRRWLRDNRPAGTVNRWLVAKGQVRPIAAP